MIVRFSGFELDLQLCELRRDGRRIPIQKKALDLLLYLIRFRGRVVSREELLANLWPGAVVTDHALNQALYVARRALATGADDQGILRTLRGRGFRFVAEVVECEDRLPLANAPFVGRSALLGELESALRATASGCGGLLLLSGEPGIGKTRLVEQFASLARDHEAVAHLGRCPEAEGAPAFWPWVQLLRAHAADCQNSELRGLLASGAHELAQIAPGLLPEFSGSVAPSLLEPGPARFRLFASTAGFWRKASEKAPVVLILDDLHRSDDPSWLLLEFLARELGSARILVVGTYREVEFHREPSRTASLGELSRLASTRSFELEGFSRAEVQRFVELTIADPVSPETITLLHERSDGNPFFLTQLAPMFDPRRRAISGEFRDGQRGVELPRSLREAITRQLAGLSSTCRELLTTAAVIGREFSLSVLELATGHSQEVVLEAVSAASDARAIQESVERIGHFRFAHILVRDALYESLSTANRVNHHKRVGEALERVYGADVEQHLSELAYHFVEALPAGGVDKAVSYATAAGRAAIAQLAFEEAVRQYERALEILDLSPTPDERRLFDLLLVLGEARIRAGKRESARETFRRAANIATRLGEPERLARVALGLAPGFFAIETGVYDSLIVSLLEDALEALPPGDSPLRASLLGRLAMALYWSDCTLRRERLIDHATAIAERLADPATSAYVIHARLAALWGPDSFEDRVATAPVLIRKAEEAGDRELSLIGRVFKIATLIEAAEVEEFDREVEAFSRLVQDPRHASTRWYATLFRAMRATLEGRFADAEDLAGEFLAEGQRFQDANVIESFGALIATVRWHQGRGHEAIEGLVNFSDSFPAVAGWRCAAMLVQAGNGQLTDVTRAFDRLASRGFSDLPRDMNWLFCMALLSEICGMIRDVGRSATLYDLLRDYADRWVMVGYGAIPWGPMARSLGILAATMSRWVEAEGFFEKALAVAKAIGALPSEAWTLSAYARMQYSRGGLGNRSHARDLAGCAKEIGSQVGMEQLSREMLSLAAS